VSISLPEISDTSKRLRNFASVELESVEPQREALNLTQSLLVRFLSIRGVDFGVQQANVDGFADDTMQFLAQLAHVFKRIAVKAVNLTKEFRIGRKLLEKCLLINDRRPFLKKLQVVPEHCFRSCRIRRASQIL